MKSPKLLLFHLEIYVTKLFLFEFCVKVNDANISILEITIKVVNC